MLKALDVPKGMPLLQVDTKAAAKRVANVHKVASSRVQRKYPSTLRVTVTERVAAAYFTAEDGTHLVDFDGVDFATEAAPHGVPRLRIDAPVQRDPRGRVGDGRARRAAPRACGQMSQSSLRKRRRDVQLRCRRPSGGVGQRR